ncbi:Maintenance of telomere capping protein 5 [Pseudocercospora fuligena]|uniref:Maintenance of telomere capping protein 5 n=1 Tax=Pseudocercospora fuligena TaxID=685502 RepID=A0A8H6RA94_9PEZI|nr:Maintenance of telomere capping protein 5 [Pseudocercospora fuligena]
MVEFDNDLEPSKKHGSEGPATYAVNAHYTAFSDYRGVFVRKLSGREAYRRLFRYEEDRPWFEPVLAFSATRLNLLAIATGLQILIFDVDTRKVKYALKGNGRVVTSVAFSKSKSSLLATGHVDGSICVWTLKHPARPLRHLRASRRACSHVAFSDYDADLIAGCHQDRVSVWSLPSTRPVLVTEAMESGLKSLHWFSSQPERVIGISFTGSVSIYNVHDAVKSFRTSVPASGIFDDSDDELGAFDGLDDLHFQPSIHFNLSFRISQALLVGRNGLIVLPHKGHVLFFVTFMENHNEPTELWRLRLDSQVDCFTLRQRTDAIEVVACFGTDAHAYEIPGPVLDGMRWIPGTSIYDSSITRESKDKIEALMTPYMRPELSLYQRIAKPPALSTSAKESSPQPLHQPTPRKKATYKVYSESSRSATPTPRSMTSSLELPKPSNDEEEHDSPMPFLSPSIPAKKASPAPLLTPLDEIVRLPPRSSFDSITSSVDHDSDSDDEAFAEIMQGSGSFLPGGVNVPLPRTCGAAFAPNGKLLTFFPSKMRPSSATENAMTPHHGDLPKLQSREVQQLFQGFGNLIRTDSDHRDSRASIGQWENGGSLESDLRRTTLDAEILWPAKVSPTKPTSMPSAVKQKVFVAVRELRPELQPDRILAEHYRILPDRHESISDVCFNHAAAAEDVGLEAVSDLWRLLALITESRTVVDPILPESGGELLRSHLSQKPILSRNPSTASSYVARSIRPALAILSWSRHPMGKAWALAQILQWAERRGDIQLLAHVSALMLQASEALVRNVQSFNSRDPGEADGAVNHLAEFASAKLDPLKLPPRIPILRAGAEFVDQTSQDEALIKARSQASSREPSQPPTPYLDSSTSTPPLGLPYFHRAGTKISVSGSVSPETHRTSFSSAAKYYAQTITDKLSSYGSSPPLKKMQNDSPGANELSSSLPNNTPGSWSKSVSFASTTDTARHSQRSLSLAQEDDDYDSDKTIDDASLPHTPKPPAGVNVKSTNGLFWDEPATSFETAFLPDQHNEQSQLWRESYAEQLRAWDLLLEAAELENIADESRAAPDRNSPSGPAVKPHIDDGQRHATCGICFCVIQAAEHMCSACLHTMHLDCLDKMLLALGETQYTCPTGCGCDCTAETEFSYGLTDDERPPSSTSLAEEVPLRPPFVKKKSLTDPRFLRDKLQGESW